MHDIDKLISEMTLEEKAGLCSGADFWHTKKVDRLGIPDVMVSDGPHGLRKQDIDTVDPNESIKAVCFPAACATACSFDRELMLSMGETLGEERRIRTARSCRKHKAFASLRKKLRIYFGRPLSCRRAFCGIYKRRAEQECRHIYKALCRKQPGNSPYDMLIGYE